MPLTVIAFILQQLSSGQLANDTEYTHCRHLLFIFKLFTFIYKIMILNLKKK